MLAAAMMINASNSAAFKYVQAQAPDVVTDCNVLCATNLIGLVTLPIFFRRDLTRHKARSVSRMQWLALFVGTLLFQVVGPFFFLRGLGGTSISQAAILARLDQVEFYVFAILLLREKCTVWDAAANGITLVAVIAAVVITPAFGLPLTLNASSVYVIMSTFGYSGSLLISKRFLASVPIGIVGTFRLLVGTLSFHGYVVAVHGNVGVDTLFAPSLWVHMAWYGLLYVTLFQSLWLSVLGSVPAPLISLGSATRFPMTLAFGFAINRDTPGGPQWVGAAMMVLALVIGSVKVIKDMARAPGSSTEGATEACIAPGYNEEEDADDASWRILDGASLRDSVTIPA